MYAHLCIFRLVQLYTDGERLYSPPLLRTNSYYDSAITAAFLTTQEIFFQYNPHQIISGASSGFSTSAVTNLQN